MAFEEYREEPASLVPLLELAALLDHEGAPGEVGAVPPLGHWLYFHPRARQSDLAADGHPRPGGLLPHDLPPRRMWAAGRVRFLAPIPVGTLLRRRTSLESITRKSGQSGPLVFVALQHSLFADGTERVIEDQTLVYRDAARATSSPAGSVDDDFGPPDFARELVLDPTALFRYSALTYNAHRIHYDRDYAMEVEGYSGLVVQGPFLATLLADHFRRHFPALAITDFAFRARRPAFADQKLRLCGRRREGGAQLWAQTEDAVVFTAEVTAEPGAKI